MLYKMSSGGNDFEFKNKNRGRSHERIDLYRHLYPAWNRTAAASHFHVHTGGFQSKNSKGRDKTRGAAYSASYHYFLKRLKFKYCYTIWWKWIGEGEWLIVTFTFCSFVNKFSVFYDIISAEFFIMAV